MLGDNPKRPFVYGDGALLSVKKIFRTLQGEGPHVGTPAIFIRLGGCNLSCDFCDTEFENYQELHVDVILQNVQTLRANHNNNPSVHMIVITGGEPLRQPIELLCQKLLDLGLQVQIETNGTLYRAIQQDVQIVCSPKCNNTEYLPIREQLLPNIIAFKFLISSNISLYSRVPEKYLKYNIPIFVQPMDEHLNEINQKNKKLAVEIAINNGYILSYQVHKALNIE